MELMQPKTAKAVNASKTMLVPEPVVAMVELTLNSISSNPHKTAEAVNAAKPMEVLVPEPVVAMVELTLNSISSNPHNTAKAVNAAKPMEVELMQPKTAKAVNATGRGSGLAKPYFIFKLKFQWQGKNGGKLF